MLDKLCTISSHCEGALKTHAASVPLRSSRFSTYSNELPSSWSKSEPETKSQNLSSFANEIKKRAADRVYMTASPHLSIYYPFTVDVSIDR